MKTLKNFMFVAFAATSILACQKEMVDLNDTPVSGEMVSFVGHVDDSQTKTFIEYEDGRTKFSTLFTATDKITVNGVQSPESVPSEDKKSISFKAEGVKAPYFAMTTTQIAKENGKYISFNTNSYAYTLMFSGKASPQKYTRVSEGNYTSFQSNTDILAAYSEDENLYFQHMSTFYAITVDAENSTSQKNIKTIYVCQGDKDGDKVFGNIAGRWYLQFDKDNDFTPIMKPSSNLTSLIAFDCGEEGLAHGTTMIIGLPAYNYENGLVFTLLDVDGNLASYKIKAEKTQHAEDGGMLIPFKPAFTPNAEVSIPGLITTAVQWNAFATFMNSAEKTDEGWARWFVDGTLRIGADIKGDLTSVNELPTGYVVDGTGKTITRENATAALFGTVSGEVKNLTLAGKLTLGDEGAPLANILAVGGTVSSCTNEMAVTFEVNDHAYVGGLIKFAKGGYIEGCVNNGVITVKVDISGADKNVAVGGLVSQIYAGSEAVSLKDCKNTSDVILAPKSATDASKGMKVCGLGGVVGWLREAGSVTLDNCDNAGNVTFSAEQISSVTGTKAYSICVGGVLGIAAPQSTSGYLTTPSATNGFDISLSNCDNTGVVYNCGVVYNGESKTTQLKLNQRVFTGGLAGSMLGKEADYAMLSNCKNTGKVYTYDLTGENASTQACASAVCGGLVGFGGYLDMNECTVNCTMGNGKRGVMSYGGVIGCVVMPFNLTESNVFVSGYFQRAPNYRNNRAIVAVAPVLWGDDAANKMNIAPNITGSKITNCKIGGSVKSSTSTVDLTNTDDLSESLTTVLFNDENKIYGEVDEKFVNNLVCGQGYETFATDVTVTGFTYWNGK